MFGIVYFKFNRIKLSTNSQKERRHIPKGYSYTLVKYKLAKQKRKLTFKSLNYFFITKLTLKFILEIIH